jgi:ParB-like chromosome segregation protein Spo0J
MKELTLPIAQIRPYPANPRAIEDAVEAVKESIARYGYQTPIVVDSEHVVVAGHVRLAALKSLGWTEVPVIVTDLSEEACREFRLIDNRSAELAEWDRDRLVAELRTMEESMAPFFAEDELKGLMEELQTTHNRTIDGESIKRGKKNLDTHFEDLSNQMKDRTKFVKCQHCGETFGFDIHIRGYGYDPHQAEAKDTAEASEEA